MVADTAVTSGNCTGVCHYAGDRYGNYTQHGHGLAQSTYKYKNGVPDASGTNVTMGYSCTACHVGLDPAQKPHADEHPDGHRPGEVRQALQPQRDDAGGGHRLGDGQPAGRHLPLLPPELRGAQDRQPGRHRLPGLPRRARRGLGVDLERDDDPGDGEEDRLLRRLAPAAQFTSKPGTETIIYDTPKWNTAIEPVRRELDRRSWTSSAQADAGGVCDSAECHGAKYTPLNTWINNAGTTHSRASSRPARTATPATSTTATTSAAGARSPPATTATTCNGRSHLGTTKSKATHDAHIASGFVTDCADCHAHDGKRGARDGAARHGGVVNFGGDRG